MDAAAHGSLFRVRLRALSARRAALANPGLRARERAWDVVPDTLAYAFFEREYDALFTVNGALRVDPPPEHESLHYATRMHNAIEYPDVAEQGDGDSGEAAGAGDSVHIQCDASDGNPDEGHSLSSMLRFPAASIKPRLSLPSPLQLVPLSDRNHIQQQRQQQHTHMVSAAGKSSLSRTTSPEMEMERQVHSLQQQSYSPSYPAPAPEPATVYKSMQMQRRTYYLDMLDLQGERRAPFADWVDDARAALSAAAVTFTKQHRPPDELQGYNNQSAPSFPPWQAPLRSDLSDVQSVPCGYGYNNYRLGRDEPGECCSPSTAPCPFDSLEGAPGSTTSAMGFQRQTFHPFRAMPKVQDAPTRALRVDQLQQHQQQQAKMARAEQEAKKRMQDAQLN
jgi:hypothetical protein